MVNKSFDLFFTDKTDFFREKTILIVSKFIENFPINKDILLQYIKTLIHNISINDSFIRI